MCFVLPLRKLFKVFWIRYCTKNERASFLNNSLDKRLERKGLWRRWFMIFLFTPILYYMFIIGTSDQPLLLQRHRPIVSEPLTTTQYIPVLKEIQIKKNVVVNITRDRNTKDNKTLGFKHKIKPTIPVNPNKLAVCLLNRTKLGPIKIQVEVGKTMSKQSSIQKGGYYVPKDCYSRHKVAILVPYRDREANLAVFLFNIHPFLMKQKLEYRIFVIEQSGTEPFNRGRLFNAGFIEMQTYGMFNCVVFHDVDLLPIDSRILYTCPTFPRHMCAAVVKRTDVITNNFSFGGVTSMTVEQYEKANGFSNLYWGWGGEDDDMFRRIRHAGFPIVRYSKNIAKFKMMPHPNQTKNKQRFELLKTVWTRQYNDGLSNMEYKLVSIALRHLYTHFVIDVNPYKKNVTEFTKRLTKKQAFGKI